MAGSFNRQRRTCRFFPSSGHGHCQYSFRTVNDSYFIFNQNALREDRSLKVEHTCVIEANVRAITSAEILTVCERPRSIYAGDYCNPVGQRDA